MTQLISARLPDETAERVRRYARRKQRSVNETVTTALEEWLRQNEFAYIEFRDTPDGRLAFMRGSRLPVYWVVKVAKERAMNVDSVLAYWPDRSRAWVESGFSYYAAYPQEIDRQIEDFSHSTFPELKRRHPQFESFEATGDDNNGPAHVQE